MKRIAYALALGAVCVTFVGCGGSDVFSAEDVARAAVATSETSSMRMAIDLEITLPGFNEPTRIIGAGAFDNVAGRGMMTMDLRPLAEATGQVLGSITTVIDGTQVYMRMPFLENSAPDSKPWLRIDVEQVAKEQGLAVDSLLQLGRSGDANETLGYLRAVAGVEEIGTHEVRGVPATHYSAVVELHKVPDVSPEESRERIQAAIDRLIAMTGKSTQPIDVWIDADGLVRKLSLEQGSPTSTTRTTIELYDFNSGVKIDVPPADQVSELSELVRQPD